MQARGFEENVVVDEGFDAHTGIHTTLSFEGDDLITRKSWDATPHLEHAAQARRDTAGKNWGEGRFIGHIPPAFYAQILVIQDPSERQAAVKRFFRENPAFLMFDGYKP